MHVPVLVLCTQCVLYCTRVYGVYSSVQRVPPVLLAIGDGGRTPSPRSSRSCTLPALEPTSDQTMAGLLATLKGIVSSIFGGGGAPAKKLDKGKAAESTAKVSKAAAKKSHRKAAQVFDDAQYEYLKKTFSTREHACSSSCGATT